MKNILRILLAGQLFLSYSITVSAQGLEPFEGCPGVSVAITRPGLNTAKGPFQIFLIDSAGAIQQTGGPERSLILNPVAGSLY